MTADTGSLTFILDHFLGVFQLGKTSVSANAWNLLSVLATIEILLAALFWAITGQDALVGLIKKLLSIGFFVFVIQNYDYLLREVIDGFIATGKAASSAGGDSLASVRDPSSIIEAGFVAVMPIFDYLRSLTSSSVIFNIHSILITLFCGLGILVAYFIIAIQVFVTYLEFGIVSTLGLILIPFGVFKHTSFIAEKIFGAIISFGVKLMVLGFLVSITVPVLKSFNLPADPSWANSFNLLVVTFAIAALAWHAPGVAAGLIAGGPSLTATTAAGTAIAGAAGTFAAGFAGSAATRAASSAISEPTKAAAGLGGIASAGASLGINNAAQAGSGPAMQTVRAATGATSSVLSAGWRNVTAPVKSAAHSVADSFKAGQSSVPGFNEMRANASSSTSSTKESASKSGNPRDKTDSSDNKSKSQAEQTEKASAVSNLVPLPEKGKGRIGNTASTLHFAKEAVPHTASPQGGITVPIKNDEESR